MSNFFGQTLKIGIFGQSHSPAIGVIIDGLPAGVAIDTDGLSRFLARRAPGRNAYSTTRREADVPEFISGLYNGKTCGAPLTAVIKNTDIRPSDYASLADIPRPGHADYTASVKYGGYQDPSGGGKFSGRLTAPLCVAGGICKQLLRERGIEAFARISAIGGIRDESDFVGPVDEKEFPVVSDECGKKMAACIAQAKLDGDSVGGIIECAVTGLPAGIGEPMFDGLENRIAAAVFAVPAVKGVEFGAGFSLAAMRGSEANDPFTAEKGSVSTATNNCGGILGGISNGMPICFKAAIKPTPSIAKPQESVSLSRMKNEVLEIKGRHDPCIVPRAVPCIEAAAAIAVYDALISEKNMNMAVLFSGGME